MALDIDECDLYLSQSKTSGNFSVASDYSCNKCSDSDLNLVLWGSTFGVPYGWKNSTSYYIKIKSTGVFVATGSLDTGIVDTHDFCLPEATYEVGFTNVASGDDFIDDDYYRGYIGIEEYQIDLYSCDEYLSTIIAVDNRYEKYNDLTKITIYATGNTCISSDTIDDTSLLQLIITYVVVILAMLVMLTVMFEACKRLYLRRLNTPVGMQDNAPTQAQIVVLPSIPVFTAELVQAHATTEVPQSNAEPVYTHQMYVVHPEPPNQPTYRERVMRSLGIENSTNYDPVSVEATQIQEVQTRDPNYSHVSVE
jgi:hypothetical protein